MPCESAVHMMRWGHSLINARDAAKALSENPDPPPLSQEAAPAPGRRHQAILFPPDRRRASIGRSHRPTGLLTSAKPRSLGSLQSGGAFVSATSILRSSAPSRQGQYPTLRHVVAFIAWMPPDLLQRSVKLFHLDSAHPRSGLFYKTHGGIRFSLSLWQA
jgi:hypothetical protein